MKKKYSFSLLRLAIIIVFASLIRVTSTAQGPEQSGIAEPSGQATKLEKFTSKTGVIIKFVDHELPKLTSSFGTSTHKVRVISSGEDIGYFYQISNKGKYSSKTASIAYVDILEVIKALGVLQQEYPIDLNNTSGYSENKFITDDGFQVGYYVDNGKGGWYVALERLGSDGAIFFKSVTEVERAFQNAKTKIEELRG